MTQETVIVSTCRCGWLAVAATVQESMKLLDEHVKWEGTEGHTGRPMSMSNPICRNAVTFLRQQAGIYRDQKHTLEILSRYSKPELQRIVFTPKPHHRHFIGRLASRFMASICAIHY